MLTYIELGWFVFVLFGGGGRYGTAGLHSFLYLYGTNVSYRWNWHNSYEWHLSKLLFLDKVIITTTTNNNIAH